MFIGHLYVLFELPVPSLCPSSTGLFLLICKNSSYILILLSVIQSCKYVFLESGYFFHFVSGAFSVQKIFMFM